MAEPAHVMNIMGGALFSVPFLGEQKRDERNCIKTKAEKGICKKGTNRLAIIFVL